MTTPAAIEITRWYLAGFFLFVAGFYGCRLLLARFVGRQPRVTYGRPGTQHWWLSLTFRVFRSLILGLMIARIPWPGLDSLLLPCPALMIAPVIIAGDILLASSFGFVIYCNLFMGKAWRSGVPESRIPPLITDGPFRCSRNPAFLGVQAAQLGFFLALPSVFTFVCLVVGVAVIQMQVRLEERHLAATFGRAYQRYRETTPRWLRIMPCLADAASSRPSV